MPFLDEIKDRLVAQGVGVFGSNIFLGSKAVIPPGPGPYLTLIETGGMALTRVQNKASANTQRPTAQVAVRGISYTTTRSMLKAAYDALDGIFNTTLSGTFYHKVTARQEPTDIGQDADGRPTIVFNIEAEKLPS
jgi:hypothetical protein